MQLWHAVSHYSETKFCPTVTSFADEVGARAQIAIWWAEFRERHDNDFSAQALPTPIIVDGDRYYPFKSTFDEEWGAWLTTSFVQIPGG